MATKNLKVLMSGDTKPYRAEIDQAGAATTKFQKSAGDSFNELAKVFGVNIGQIKGQLTAFEGGFKTLLSSMKASAAGASFFSGAMNVVKIALASTGIGLLVVALGTVVAYFTSTREGANKVKIVLAEIGAVVRVLVDRFSSFGEGLVKVFTLDFAGAAKAFKASVSGIGAELLDEASAAGRLTKETQALNKEEREAIVLQQQRKTKAAELRYEAKQEEYSAQEKKKMLNEAKQLIVAYYEEEKRISIGRRDILEKETLMHKATGSQLTELEESKAKVLSIDQEQAQELKAMSREYNKVNKEIASQTAEILKNAEAKRKADAEGLTKSLGNTHVGLKLKDPVLTAKVKLEDVVQDPKLKAIDDKMFTANIEKSQKLSDARWRKEWSNMDHTEKAFIDLSSSIQGGLSDMSTGVGELIGSFLSGQGGIESFGTMVAGVFADMAINVGKIAIATGFAASGIMAALKLHPALAIAAGIALVALGTAVKGGLANVASGGATGSMPGGGGQNYNYDTRGNTAQASAQKVNVTVAGEFKLQNKTLVAGLNQENTRVAIST